MPAGPDDKAFPIALVCEIADVSRQLRKTWIARRLVSGDTSGACSENEALDLCAFAALVRALGFEEARLSWPQVRDAARRRWGSDPLDVVVDLRRKRAVLALDDGTIAAIARDGNQVRLISLAQTIDTARGDLRNALAVLVDTAVRRPTRDE
jgi:hypothetical protein